MEKFFKPKTFFKKFLSKRSEKFLKVCSTFRNILERYPRFRKQEDKNKMKFISFIFNSLGALFAVKERNDKIIWRTRHP